MENIRLMINGLILGFGHVWVHMQDIESKINAKYSVTVPRCHWKEVFDPHNSKPNELAWKDFLVHQVEVMGTFVLGAYFKNMARIVDDDSHGFQWVIATLDDVVDSTDSIELKGKAVIFDQNRV